MPQEDRLLVPVNQHLDVLDSNFEMEFQLVSSQSVLEPNRPASAMFHTRTAKAQASTRNHRNLLFSVSSNGVEAIPLGLVALLFEQEEKSRTVVDEAGAISHDCSVGLFVAVP